MDDLRGLFTIGGFIIGLLGFVFARAEKSNKAATQIKELTHKNELAIEKHSAFNAQHYATKDELRAVVADLKENLNGRFDRLELKLDRDKNK